MTPREGTRLAIICCCLAASLCAQTSPVPYENGGGPLFSVHDESHSYPGSYSSIRKIDFHNLDNGEVALKNGHYERNEPDDHYSVDLESVHYLTGTSRNGDGSALVIYAGFEAGGSSNTWEYGVVFTLSKGHLQAVQSIRWSTHAAGTHPTWSFDPKTNTLVVRSDHYRPGDAHCCISAVDVVTYRWDHTRFTQAAIRTEQLNN